jgi:hypothetical protein
MVMKYFVLTNDPDHGKTEDYRRILKLLAQKKIFVTTAVFCTLKEDGSSLSKHCHKGETNTLEDKDYRGLMLQAKEWGHEIAFHGYSQVSDSRDEFKQGLKIFSSIFGEAPRVYFEHGGHPDKHPIDMVKKENLSYYGSDKKSIYYVKDIIKDTFDVVWTHDYLMDFLKNPLNLKDIFIEKDGIIYLKRWRMYHFNDIKNKISKIDNTIVGYTHFGYGGYRSNKNFIKNYFDKNSYLERWIDKQDCDRAVELLKNFIEEDNVKSLTVSGLYKEYLKSV